MTTAMPHLMLERLLLQEILAEIGGPQQAGEPAHSFYRSIGARLAAVTAGEDSATVAGLEADLNRVWAALGLGSAIVQMRRDGLVIRHRFPTEGSMLTEVVPKSILSALLEGWYEHWLNILAGTDSFMTRCHHSGEREVEFRHGVKA